MAGGRWGKRCQTNGWWNALQNRMLTAPPVWSDDEPFQVTLSDESFETYELDPPPYTIEVTKKELKQMYYEMVAIRYAATSASRAARGGEY